MKAIHNNEFNEVHLNKVGNYMLKYNFESNSQREGYITEHVGCWELYAKVQFWKQFTTSR